jgi:hypothetical protein
MRKMPSTDVSWVYAATLTVKLDQVVDDRLAERASRLLLGHKALRDGTALLDLQEDEHRDGDEGEDDGERAERPAPVGLVELLRDLGARVRRDDPRRGGERVREASVAEVRDVGGEDVDGEDHADETDRVEDLLSADNKCKLTCAAQYV